MALTQEQLNRILGKQSVVDRVLSTNAIEQKLNAPENIVTGGILPIQKNKVTGQMALAMPEFIKSMQQAYTAPARAMRGEFDPNSVQGVQEANNIGLNLLGIGQTAPIVSRGSAAGMEGGKILGTMIGDNSKLWNAPAGRVARKLEEKGVSPERIWQLTADKMNAPTGKAADNRLRQEISDYWTLSNPVEKGKSASINDILDQDLGYKQLQGVFVNPSKTQTAYMSGSYPPEIVSEYYKMIQEPIGKYANQENRIYNVANAMDKKGTLTPKNDQRLQGLLNRIEEKMFTSPQDYKESILYDKPTLLHERQHAIQDIEGFPLGGSVDEFKGLLRQHDYFVNRSNETLLRAERARKNKGIDPESKLSLKEILEQQKNYENKIKDLRNKGALLSPEQAYYNLAGEAEARMVERRSKMIPQDMGKNYPFKYDPKFGYDVEIDKLIYK